jgi:hypothetical protein
MSLLCGGYQSNRFKEKKSPPQPKLKRDPNQTHILFNSITRSRMSYSITGLIFTSLLSA